MQQCRFLNEGFAVFLFADRAEVVDTAFDKFGFARIGCLGELTIVVAVHEVGTNLRFLAESEECSLGDVRVAELLLVTLGVFLHRGFEFVADTENEKNLLLELCEQEGYPAVSADVWGHGGAGGEDLARKVVEIANLPSQLTHPYELEDSIEEKITKIVQKVYGGAGIAWTKEARRTLRKLERLGFHELPVCMAKTQYSLSDNPKAIGRPEGFTITISDLTVSAGAGFIVVLTGNVMKMPGLPKVPSAERIDIDSSGKITGLF